jgi:hypothetical protein
MSVIWATTDEESMATALVELVERQFRREPLEPIYLPFTFSEMDSPTASP